VARYFFLMRRGDTQMLFDLDLALDHSEKNPVYKVQYAHARMMSIFRRPAWRPTRSARLRGCLDRLTRRTEQEMIKQLGPFPEVVAAPPTRARRTWCASTSRLRPASSTRGTTPAIRAATRSSRCSWPDPRCAGAARARARRCRSYCATD
jgi:hypothetical protein